MGSGNGGQVEAARSEGQAGTGWAAVVGVAAPLGFVAVPHKASMAKGGAAAGSAACVASHAAAAHPPSPPPSRRPRWLQATQRKKAVLDFSGFAFAEDQKVGCSQGRAAQCRAPACTCGVACAGPAATPAGRAWACTGARWPPRSEPLAACYATACVRLCLCLQEKELEARRASLGKWKLELVHRAMDLLDLQRGSGDKVGARRSGRSKGVGAASGGRAKQCGGEGMEWTDGGGQLRTGVGGREGMRASIVEWLSLSGPVGLPSKR